MQPPPDNDVVLRRELDGAIAEGTNAALIRFVARHGSEPIAEEARDRLARRSEPDAAVSRTDPDSAIYQAFDEARLDGTSEAYRLFISRFANHPLAAEAGLRLKALEAQK